MARVLPAVIRSNRGQAVIEFALVFPLLLLVCFGITEFGRAWMTMNILTSAAREGVRLAAVTAPDVPAVQQRVRDVCDAARVVPSAITVVPPDPNDTDRRVSVTVETQFEVIPGQILGTFSGTFPLHATSIMRHEAQ
jgi:Flp pilus assembly protein TadG